MYARRVSSGQNTLGNTIGRLFVHRRIAHFYVVAKVATGRKVIFLQATVIVTDDPYTVERPSAGK